MSGLYVSPRRALARLAAPARLRASAGLGLAVGLAAGLAAGAVDAQTLSVTQMRQANVYGVIQVGPQVRPTTVTQTGQSNMVGIMQSGTNPRASITQSGRTNSAFIGQYDAILPRGSLRMP